MAEFEETVTTRDDEGVDSSGAEVRKQTRRVDTKASADGAATAANVVWLILAGVEILIGFRFVLKLLGANPSSGFVDFVYDVTGVLTAPFDNIFNVTSAQAGDIRSVFEPSILVAAAVYALIAWVIVKLLSVNRDD